MISHRGSELDLVPFPFWGPMPLPLWVILLIFGRELLVTLFRSYAAARGVVIAAGKSGKRKALFQALFIGSLLLWYPLLMVADRRGWDGALWTGWAQLHQAWVGITLAVAIVLTVYSMLDYLWSYRSVVGIRN